MIASSHDCIEGKQFQRAYFLHAGALYPAPVFDGADVAIGACRACRVWWLTAIRTAQHGSPISNLSLDEMVRNALQYYDARGHWAPLTAESS